MPDGYVQRAQYWAGKKQLEKANNDYATALSKSTTCTDTTAQTEDAVHYAISSSIYRNVMAAGKDSTLGQDWNLARAEHEADLAYKVKPMALYMVQRATANMPPATTRAHIPVSSQHAMMPRLPPAKPTFRQRVRSRWPRATTNR